MGFLECGAWLDLGPHQQILGGACDGGLFFGSGLSNLHDFGSSGWGSEDWQLSLYPTSRRYPSADF